MRPALHPTAPSRRLLRFLRSQSEGVPFFAFHHVHTPSQAPAAPCHGQTRRLTSGATVPTTSDPKPSSRPYSTSRCGRPEAALPSPATHVGTLLPRHLKRVRSPGLSLLAANSIAASHRFMSSEETVDGKSKKTVAQRLWGDNAVRPDFRSHVTNELEDSIFTSSMGRRARAALEPVLRCTEVDEKGDAILTDGAFKKTELIAKVSHSAYTRPQMGLDIL